LESIEIYLDFDEGGHTTAGAIGYFNELKSKNVEILVVSEDDVKMIRDVLQQAKRKKYHQTKHGGNMMFCNFIYNSDVSKTGISISNERAMIIDFTAQTLYIVNDSIHLNWIADFARKIKEL